MQDNVATGNFMSSLTMSAHIDLQDNVTGASLIASMAARSTMSSICQQLPDGVLLQYPYLPVDPKVPASPELFLNMFLFLFLTQPFA